MAGPSVGRAVLAPFATAVVVALEESRTELMSVAVAASVAVGRPMELIPVVETLVAENPLSEPLAAASVRPLYAAGRQAAALERLGSVRRILVEELGLDPSPFIADLERRILTHDPSLQPPLGEPETRPTGTVALLFTDIEGSTQLWENSGEAMSRALARHDSLMRSVVDGFGGRVFKTVGDSVCAVLATASEAVQAAVEAQRRLMVEPWPAEAPLRVRMAIHIGRCEERDGDYFGPPVNRVARLVAIAHGEQIIVSGAWPSSSRTTSVKTSR